MLLLYSLTKTYVTKDTMITQLNQLKDRVTEIAVEMVQEKISMNFEQNIILKKCCAILMTNLKMGINYTDTCIYMATIFCLTMEEFKHIYYLEEDLMILYKNFLQFEAS